MSPALIALAFIVGLAIPLFLVRGAFKYLRPQHVIKLIEQQSEPAPPWLLIKNRARLTTTDQRAQWDQLVRSVREHRGGIVRVGHVEWIAQVIAGTAPAEPIPDLRPRGGPKV